MNTSFTISGGSRHLRMSLKRGIARQAMRAASLAEANAATVLTELRRMGRNRRAMERTALRLRRSPGVVRAGLAGGRVVLVMRTVCSAVNRQNGVDIYTEDLLMYLRVSISTSRKGMGVAMNCASFCLHALERLIERSGCEMGGSFLSVVDAEAALVLKRAFDGECFELDEDSYVAAKEAGVWAGSLDTTVLGPDWVDWMELVRVPTFSVRTFLGADEMKPTVWLRWQADPRLSIAA